MEAVPRLSDIADSDIGIGRLGAFGLRMRVWWAKDRLTRQLARGSASVDSRELALRAGQLTAKRTREVVASSIDDVIDQADRPRAAFSSQAPVNLKKVRAVRQRLVELGERLRAPGPIRPQGMALVVLLLSDPEQPLFGIGSEDDLASAILYASRRLDPPTLDDAS
jgi:hypothetical protein